MCSAFLFLSFYSFLLSSLHFPPPFLLLNLIFLFNFKFSFCVVTLHLLLCARVASLLTNITRTNNFKAWLTNDFVAHFLLYSLFVSSDQSFFLHRRFVAIHCFAVYNVHSLHCVYFSCIVRIYLVCTTT